LVPANKDREPFTPVTESTAKPKRGRKKKEPLTSIQNDLLNDHSDINQEPVSAKSGRTNKNGQNGKEEFVNLVDDLLNNLSNQDDRPATRIGRAGTKEGNGQTSIIDLSDDEDTPLKRPFVLDYENLDNGSEVSCKEIASQAPLDSPPYGIPEGSNNLFGSFNRPVNLDNVLHLSRPFNNTFRSNNASAFGLAPTFPTPFAPTLPTPFRDMETIYQLCSWLCANPNVLQFAYNMYQSMQVPVNGSFHISPILSTVPQEQNQGIMQSQDKVIIFIYF